MTGAALDDLRKFAEGPDVSPALRRIAYSAIAIGLSGQGESDSALSALEKATASMPSDDEKNLPRPDWMMAEALLREATLLLDK